MNGDNNYYMTTHSHIPNLHEADSKDSQRSLDEFILATGADKRLAQQWLTGIALNTFSILCVYAFISDHAWDLIDAFKSFQKLDTLNEMRLDATQNITTNGIDSKEQNGDEHKLPLSVEIL